MDKNEVMKILEMAKDKNGEVPMRLVRQAFEKLPEPYKDTISRQAAIEEINKGTHGITESDKISYSVICDKFQSPHIYFNTYDEAEHWARFNQPNYRPYYIIKRSEHFEIVGEVR